MNNHKPLTRERVDYIYQLAVDDSCYPDDEELLTLSDEELKLFLAAVGERTASGIAGVYFDNLLSTSRSCDILTDGERETAERAAIAIARAYVANWPVFGHTKSGQRRYRKATDIRTNFA